MNENDLSCFIDTLPSYPGIHGKERLFNSAVFMPFVLIDGEYHLLFEKRAQDISQGGEICFPGGRHDPETDKSCMETAVRETVEELGIGHDKITVKGVMDTLIAPMGASVDVIVGTIDIETLDEIKLQKAEVETIFTVPVSWFENNKPEKYTVRLEVKPSYVNEKGEEIQLLPVEELGLPERYRKPWGGRKYRVLVYKTDEGLIWGITAELVYEAVKKYLSASGE